MRTRSNPVALMIAMIVGLSLTSVSCSPESTSPARGASEGEPSPAQNAISLQDQYAWTGKYHNDALAYAFTRIKESKQLSKFDKCKTGLAALKDFQKAFRKSGGNAVFADLTLTDGMCEAAGSVSNRVASAKGFDPSSLTPLADISAAANDYMNQISYQVDIATSVEYLASSVSRIVKQAGATVAPLEAAAVATTGSIAVSSADYWTATEGTATDGGPAPYARSQNVSSDGMELGPTTPAFGISPRSKRIIKADVAAAVTVLLAKWWAGEAAVAEACIKAAAASLIAGIYFT